MNCPHSQRLAACALMLAPISRAADLFDETKGTTIFAFDNVSIPHTFSAIYLQP